MNNKEYQRVHSWINRVGGKASVCIIDNSHQAKRYHWANISGKYNYDISDWQQMCPRCHKKMDGVSEYMRQATIKRNKGNNYRSLPVLMIYPEGSWIKYRSARAAQRATGILDSAISNVLCGRTKTAGGYRWRRV